MKVLQTHKPGWPYPFKTVSEKRSIDQAIKSDKKDARDVARKIASGELMMGRNE